MVVTCALVGVTTLVFHGAHVLGYQKWADAVFMKYDVSAVFVGAAALLTVAPADLLPLCLATLGASLVLWLLSFGPLHGLPFNPILTVIHCMGAWLHLRVMSALCI